MYGGLVAAPIIKAIIEGAFASTRTAIDRRALAAQVIPTPIVPDSGVDLAVAAPQLTLVRVARRARSDASDGVVPYLMAIAPVHRSAAAPPAAARPVPDVSGLSIREALFTLHEQGFRVVVDTLAGGGTSPAAGTSAMPASLIRLHRIP